MDWTAYEVEARVEANHWWFVGRRRLFAQVLTSLGLPASARILDVGTGTGSNLRLLRDLGFTQVSGVDSSPPAIRFCRSKGFQHVEEGDALHLPFPNGSFDFLLATDVLEHIEDDTRAIREILRVLVPGGRVLFTVPAFPSLWGAQDEVGHHRRRYRLSSLATLIESTGLRVAHSHYFNYLLFLPIWAARKLMRLMGFEVRNENQLNTPILNSILAAIFWLDVRTAPVLKPPLGVSLLVVAQRPGGAGE